jgi:hypothetical protein
MTTRRYENKKQHGKWKGDTKNTKRETMKIGITVIEIITTDMMTVHDIH